MRSARASVTPPPQPPRPPARHPPAPAHRPKHHGAHSGEQARGATRTRGAALALRVRIWNAADAPEARAEAVAGTVFRSNDGAFDSDDHTVEDLFVGLLGPGASHERAIVTPAPQRGATFWYGVCAAAHPAETSTSNNCSPPFVVRVHGSDASPDLRFQAVHVGPRFWWGTIENIGRARAGLPIRASVHFRDQSVGFGYLRQPLPPGASDTLSSRISYDSRRTAVCGSDCALTPGDRVRLCIEPPDRELRTDNNCIDHSVQ